MPSKKSITTSRVSTVSSTHKQDIFVSVVVPVENQADSLSKYLSQVYRVLNTTYTNFEIVVVDNGSKDNLLEQIKKLLVKFRAVRVLRLARSYDIETAIFAGLETAIGDYVVVMISEVDPPSLIKKSVSMLSQNDLVFGVDSSGGKPKTLYDWFLVVYYLYLEKALGISVYRHSTYFVALNRRAINALTRVTAYYRHLRLLAAQIGYKHNTLAYKPFKPNPWRIKRGWWGSINLGITTVITYSSHPLRIVAWVGLFASFANALYGVYVLLIYLFKSDVVEGWTTTSLQISFMFFLVFIILAVLAEYVGRILQESQRLPHYHVLEELNSNVMLTSPDRRNIISK